MGVIYVRPNLINGKKYVGQAVDIERRQRKWNNLNQPYAGKAINAARKKYGIDAFDFEILKECEDEELDFWEMYYIKELNTKAPNGYNLTDGGDGMKGYHWSEESKIKLSETNKGRHLSEEAKKKISRTLKGRKKPPLSEETKKKLSEAAKRRTFSEEYKKKLSETFKGRTFSEETRRKLSESLKGRTFSEERKRNISEAKKGIPNLKLSKPVLQIDKNTNDVIAEFPSIHQVERDLGLNFKNISSCCNNKRKTAYGFIWRYKESVA